MIKEFFNKFKRKPQMVSHTIRLVDSTPILEGEGLSGIRAYEQEAIKNTDQYICFGFVYGHEREMPKFFTTAIPTDNENESIVKFMHCATPTILTHCVHQLTLEAKKEEAQNLSNFKEKCYEISQFAKFQEDDWDKTITKLVNYMAQYVEKKNEDQNENC